MIDLSGSVSWAAAAQVLASVVGFMVVGYQIRLLWRNTRGATQDRLYGHYMEVCKLFMQNPHLRPFFYENMQVPDNDPKLRAEVDAMCEAVLGLIEHSVVQKCNLPDDGWKGCWAPYAQVRMQDSYELTNFFSLNQRWYTRKLGKALLDMGAIPPALPAKAWNPPALVSAAD